MSSASVALDSITSADSTPASSGRFSTASVPEPPPCPPPSRACPVISPEPCAISIDLLDAHQKAQERLAALAAPTWPPPPPAPAPEQTPTWAASSAFPTWPPPPPAPAPEQTPTWAASAAPIWPPPPPAPAPEQTPEKIVRPAFFSGPDKTARPLRSMPRASLQILTFGLQNCDSELVDKCRDWDNGGAEAWFDDNTLRGALRRLGYGSVDLIIDARCFPDPHSHRTGHTGVHPEILSRISFHPQFQRFLRDKVRWNWQKVYAPTLAAAMVAALRGR